LFSKEPSDFGFGRFRSISLNAVLGNSNPSLILAVGNTIKALDIDGNVVLEFSGYEAGFEGVASANVDEDEYNEFITVNSGAADLIIFDHDGTFKESFFLTGGQWTPIYSGWETPIISDVDDDGKNEIIVANSASVGSSTEIKLYLFETEGMASDGGWPMFMHDPQHTGLYTKPIVSSDCGNNIKDDEEECDGTDDDACVDRCSESCTCLPMSKVENIDDEDVTGTLIMKLQKNEGGDWIDVSGAVYSFSDIVIPAEGLIKLDIGEDNFGNVLFDGWNDLGVMVNDHPGEYRVYTSFDEIYADYEFEVECNEGLTDCFGSCVDLQTDVNNCGACGNVCGQGESCVNGVCDDGSTTLNLGETTTATVGEKEVEVMYFAYSSELNKGRLKANDVLTKALSTGDSEVVIEGVDLDINDVNSGSVTFTLEETIEEVEPRIEIDTCEKLQDIINNDLNAHYILIKDIDCSDTVNWCVQSGYGKNCNGFEPIGNRRVDYPNNVFIGTFDGQGYTISNLYINRPDENSVGLFGATLGGVGIKRVGLVDVDIVGGRHDVGGLLGRGGALIERCSVTGSVRGEYYAVGGVVGYFNGTIKDSYSKVNIDFSYSGGGLIGEAKKGSYIEDCYSTGNVNGGHFSGGLIGHIVFADKVKDSFSTSDVQGAFAGGLIGSNTYGGYYPINSYYTDKGGLGTKVADKTLFYDKEYQLYFTKGRFEDAWHWDFDKVWMEVDGDYPMLKGYKDIICKDSDGGIDYDNKGKVTYTDDGYNFFTDEDWCSTNMGEGGFTESCSGANCHLVELYCSTAIPGDIDNSVYPCEDGCQDGSCIVEIPIEDCWDDLVDPRPICTCEDLQRIGQDIGALRANYELQNDIDCSDTVSWNDGKGFVPISDYSFPIDCSVTFCGNLDGQGYTINDLYIDSGLGDNIGLFGSIASGSEIINIALVNVDIRNSGVNVGGIVGTNLGGDISKSFVSGLIRGKERVGGLVGMNNEGVISDSYSIANIHARANSGGFVGWNIGKISNSYSTGDITITDEQGYSGGFISWNSGTIENSFCTGRVSGGTKSASFISYNQGGTISNVFYQDHCRFSPCPCINNDEGSTDCTAIKDPTYFEDSGNDPLKEWDFTNVWEEVDGGYPNFRICINGETRYCPLQQGVCIDSYETCTNKQWPGCDYSTIASYETIETTCDDILDNDCDGLIDKEDSDCQSKNRKDLSKYAAKEAFLISSRNWRDVLPLVPVTTWTSQDKLIESDCKKGTETPEDVCVYPSLIFYEEIGEICDNGIDDNANALIDCADYYCSSFPGCSEDCSDGIDNDGDGYLDCNDQDCDSSELCYELFSEDLSADEITQKIFSTGFSKFDVSIDGDRIMWWQFYMVLMHNLTSQTTKIISTGSTKAYDVSIDGDRIVWRQNDENNNHNIFMHDLSTSQTTKITSSTYSKSDVSIDGDRIVWKEYKTIFMHDLSTGVRIQIIHSKYPKYDISIDGDRIVWRRSSYTIFMHDLSVVKRAQITSNGFHKYGYSNYGNKIAWLEKNNEDYTLFMHNLLDRKTLELLKLSSYYPSLRDSPLSSFEIGIHGDKIVGNMNILDEYIVFIYDLSTRSFQEIINDDHPKYGLDVSEEDIIWVQETTGEYSIFRYNFAEKIISEIELSEKNSAITDIAIDGNNIVWTQKFDGKTFLYLYNLLDKETFLMMNFDQSRSIITDLDLSEERLVVKLDVAEDDLDRVALVDISSPVLFSDWTELDIILSKDEIYSISLDSDNLVADVSGGTYVYDLSDMSDPYEITSNPDSKAIISKENVLWQQKIKAEGGTPDVPTMHPGAKGEIGHPDHIFYYEGFLDKIDEKYQAFDADSIIYFMQQYGVDHLTIVGDTQNELDRLLVTEPQLGAGLEEEQIQRISPENYLSYWEYYEDVVYVEDDYSLALSASTYASLINAPLIIQGSSLDDSKDCGVNPCIFDDKNVILVGVIGCPSGMQCEGPYDLEQLEQKYFDNTNTDKLIVVNPDDWYVIYEHTGFPYGGTYPSRLKPEKSLNYLTKLYVGTSLSSPFLASAKHELIIQASSVDENKGVWREKPSKGQKITDELIENKVTDLNMDASYLTIIGSPDAIPMQYQLPGWNGELDRKELDFRIYADLDEDEQKQSELAVGRIMGFTLSDVSSLIARTIFYQDIKPEKTAFLMVQRGDPRAVVNPEEENPLEFKFIKDPKEGDATIQYIPDYYYDTGFCKAYFDVECEELFVYKDYFDSYAYCGETQGGMPWPPECDVRIGELSTQLHDSTFVVFADHGAPFGWYPMIKSHGRFGTSAVLEELPPLFAYAFACLTCAHSQIPMAFDDKKPKYPLLYERSDLFCANMIRNGAIGYIGAIEATAGNHFLDEFLEEAFDNDKSVGEAFKIGKNKERIGDWETPYADYWYNIDPSLSREEVNKLLIVMYDLHDVLIGDPTFNAGNLKK